MGTDYARLMQPGRSTAVSPADRTNTYTPMVPGKSTLAEQQPPAPDFATFLAEWTRHELATVSAQQGMRFRDRGMFEFEVKSDGAFEIVSVPGGPEGRYGEKLHKTIRLADQPVVWRAIREVMPQAKAQAVAHADAPQAASTGTHATQLANERAIRHDDRATIAGTPLEVGATRASGTYGDAGTHYYWPSGRADTDPKVQAVWKGAADAKSFWCSGFSMWSLAAAGYDLEAPARGDDQQPFTYVQVYTLADTDAAKHEKQKQSAAWLRDKQYPDATAFARADGATFGELEYGIARTIAFREVIDGQQLPVLALASGRTRGNLGVFRSGADDNNAGFRHAMVEHDGELHASLAARGAPGAFELLHIGTEVSEAEQKPGDFVQQRWKTVGENGDTELTHRGGGHAFQI
ncbi:MAG TPA: hypothetical protein VFQ65_30845, partial [Kofleriaceae bacterium]|nr:hypothetical protein [Kofleriaceae bacterium]